MVTDILSDKRMITRISSATIPDEWDWMVDDLFGITKIVAYEEHGGATRFAVYVGDDIQWRVPAHSMVVEYGTAPTTEEQDAKTELFLYPQGRGDG